MSSINSDATNYDGYGDSRAANELIKAISAGQITGRDTANQILGGEPLKMESVERVLKNLEFRMKDIKLWNGIPKAPTTNTVDEFLQLNSYGSNRGGFYDEGELSDTEDFETIRRSEQVKYIQVTGEVTLQSQMTRNFADVMRLAVDSKAMWILRKTNESLVKADSSIVTQEFNGLYKQHQAIGSENADIYSSLNDWQDSSSVIDLRGGSLTQNDLEDASVNVDEAFGSVSHVYAPPTAISGLSKSYFEVQRILQGGSSFNGTIGTTPKSIGTSFGDIGLMTDKSMKRDPAKKLSTTATSLKAPNAPVASAVNVVASDPSSRYAASDVTSATTQGTCFYAVSSINKYGESALTVMPDATTATTVAAGSSVDLTFTDGGGATPATGYVIYRSLTTAAANASTGDVTFYPIFKASKANLINGYDGAAAGSIRDRGRFLPNTEDGFVSEMSEDVMSFKQLAPMSKLDLAVQSTSKRFIMYLYGTPQLYAPRKMVRFINIGPYVAS